MKKYSHKTTLSSFYWYLKETSNKMSNGNNKILDPQNLTELFHRNAQRLTIVSNLNKNELLNIRSDLFLKCRPRSNFSIK